MYSKGSVICRLRGEDFSCDPGSGSRIVSHPPDASEIESRPRLCIGIEEADAMDLGLRGRHAIVTGGSLGIGKAIARELAREGADVAIVARTKEQLQGTARELQTETGRRIIPLVADVTSRAQVDAMVEQAVGELGGLHILVNSGSPPGGSPSATGPIESLVDEDL